MVMLLSVAGCGYDRPAADRSSVTVKLPAAHPHTPGPAFSFKNDRTSANPAPPV
jgi:hypothetical protein